MSEKLVKTARALAIATLMLASASAFDIARAQQAGITRTDLQRHDISVPGHEAFQVRVDFAPGAAFGRHTHPGEEIIYVLEGTLEYEIEGKPHGHAEGRRRALHPRRNDPCGKKRRQRQGQRVGDLYSRKGQAGADPGEMTAITPAPPRLAASAPA